MFAVEDEDWLQKFIEDYKAKLAKERLELSSMTSVRVMKSQQACHEVEKEQTADDTICYTPSLGNTLEVTGSSSNSTADLMTSIGRDERRESVDRKKKQEEYHRILDQQLAEKKERKLQEKLIQLDDLENTTSHETTRSPSPPIKSHYRNFVPNRVPSRPLSANANQQRLSDLTELRQLYSNR